MMTVGAVDLLERMHQRLDEGLSEEQWHEILRLLVTRITVHTTVDETGEKRVKAQVVYRFPGSVLTSTDNPASMNYTARIYRRVIELPSGKQKKAPKA